MAELGAGSGSGYPAALDTDINLEVNSPNADKTLARAEVPNDLASAIIAIQTELGINPAGSLTDVKTFLQTEHSITGTHSLAINDLTDVNAGSPSDTQVITWNAATSKWISAAGGSGSPGGADTYVQYNDSGSFGGDSGFVFNETTNDVTILGNLTVGAEGGGTKVISVAGSDATGTAEGGELRLFMADDYDTTYNFWRIDVNEDDLRIGAEGQTYVTIKDDGKSGFGMTNPNEMLTVEGAISLDEITAPSLTAGYGKIYVKSSDSLLYFKDDGGNEYDLTAGGGAGGWTDDGTVVRLTTSTDNVGMGTTTSPHGGVGAAMLSLEGVNASVDGPIIQFTTASDDYPLMQINPRQHDGVNISFDAYRDTGWKSSHSGSNFRLAKGGNNFRIQYASGIAQGSAISSWSTGLGLDTTGLVSIISRIRFSSITNSSPADGDVWYGSGDFWGYKAGVTTSLTSLALDDLTDVNAGTPSNNDALTWDTATSKWIPEAISGASLWTSQTGYIDSNSSVYTRVYDTETGDGETYSTIASYGSTARLRVSRNCPVPPVAGLAEVLDVAIAAQTESKGNNTDFIGSCGMFACAKDRSDVNASNNGVLMAFIGQVYPRVSRDNSPADDVNGIMIMNQPTGGTVYTATDAYYVSHDPVATAYGSEWANAFNSDAYCSLGLRLGGKITNAAIHTKSADISNSVAIFMDSTHRICWATADSDINHYLYRSGNDIYWFDGTTGTKLN